MSMTVTTEMTWKLQRAVIDCLERFKIADVDLGSDVYRYLFGIRGQKLLLETMLLAAVDLAQEIAGGGWISIENQLPEQFVNVLVWPRTGPEVTFWTGDRFHRHAPVTHWRPLPPGPEGA